jgi:hypothetical protein
MDGTKLRLGAIVADYTVKTMETVLRGYTGDDVASLANIKLWASMPERERLLILSAMASLANSVRKMGCLMSLEIVLALGRKLALMGVLDER